MLEVSATVLCCAGCEFVTFGTDYAYVDAERSDLPFHICRIRDLKTVSKWISITFGGSNAFKMLCRYRLSNNLSLRRLYTYGVNYRASVKNY